MEQEHASKLVKAASIIASVQEDQLLFTAITEIAKLPLQELLSEQSARHCQLKALLSLKSMVTALTDLPETSLTQAIQDLFKQTWPRLSLLMQTQSSDSELLDACADYLWSVHSYLPPDDLFMPLQQALLGAF